MDNIGIKNPNDIGYSYEELGTVSNLPTPKIQHLPDKQDINDILERRSNFSVIKGHRPMGSLNISSQSNKPILAKVENSNIFKGSTSPIKSRHNVEDPSSFLKIPKLAPGSQGAPINLDRFASKEAIHHPTISSHYETTQKKLTIASPQGKNLYTPIIKTPTISSASSRRRDKIAGEIENQSKISFSKWEGLDYSPESSTKFNLLSQTGSKFEPLHPRRRDIFLKESILDHIITFLSCSDLLAFSTLLYEFRHQKKYKTKFNKQLYQFISQGLDKLEQYLFWDSFIKFKKLKEDHPTAFTQNFVRQCLYIKDIRKDVDRTLPEHDKYSTEEGKSSLLRVLVALSNSIKDVGYIQGLNSIAGVFLFYLKEEQSFWATLYLLEKLKFKDILQEGFQNINILNYQFEVLLYNYVPHVANHLKFQSITLSYITTPWFITLFSYYLSLPNVLKVWNFFFLKGSLFLLKFGLAIFLHYQNEILNLDPDEVPSFLKHELRELSDYDERLFQKANEFKVTKKMLKDIQYYYNSGKPMLLLKKDHNNKIVWEITYTTIERKNEDTYRKSREGYSKISDNKKNLPNIRRNFSLDQKGVATEGPSKLQNFMHTIKMDFPQSFKNVFNKKPEEPEPRSASIDHRQPKAFLQLSNAHQKIERPIPLESDPDQTPKIYKNMDSDWNNPYSLQQADKYVDNFIKSGSHTSKAMFGGDYGFSPLAHGFRNNTSNSPTNRKAKPITRSPSLASPIWALTSESRDNFSSQTSLKCPENPNEPKQDVHQRYLTIISLSKIESTIAQTESKGTDGEQFIRMNLDEKYYYSKEPLSSISTKHPNIFPLFDRNQSSIPKSTTL